MRSHLIRPALILALAACVLPALPQLAAATMAATPQKKTASVRIDNFTFGPQAMTVAPGTTVTWINNDDTPHTVVAVNKAFRSKPLDTGDSFSFTFDRAGEFAYFCGLHPHMTGKIVVKAA